MGDGFSVDLDAMNGAVDGILQTMDQMATTRVSSLQSNQATMGHEALSSKFGEFCRRWDIGVDNLQHDAAVFANGLATAAKAYGATDLAQAAGFEGAIGSSTGPDPGKP